MNQTNRVNCEKGALEPWRRKGLYRCLVNCGEVGCGGSGGNRAWWASLLRRLSLWGLLAMSVIRVEAERGGEERHAAAMQGSVVVFILFSSPRLFIGLFGSSWMGENVDWGLMVEMWKFCNFLVLNTTSIISVNHCIGCFTR